jgi:FolB domain-containing protein
MDRINLRGIVANGRHGANSGEREIEQPFHVDIELEMNLKRAGRSDDLADTVNYAEVHAAVLDIVQNHSYALLEKLASKILDAIMCDERVSRARVSVAKPLLLDGATPSVTMARSR